MRKKRFVIFFVILLAGLLLLVLFCDRQVIAASKNRTFYDAGHVPHNHVGLLLGTSKYLNDGSINLYYKYRIEAAVTLIKAGKIEYIIISGDNGHKEYNEPEMMRADLIAAGVDSSHIYLDYAGFRTFDSIIRIREIFSQYSVTVISQKFHNQRALFIARREGIEAVGFNARDVSKATGFRVQLREKLARVKVFADYVFGKKPKFLGAKIAIP